MWGWDYCWLLYLLLAFLMVLAVLIWQARLLIDSLWPKLEGAFQPVTNIFRLLRILNDTGRKGSLVSSSVRRVLVFGESGVGKTSMLNALTGCNYPTSNDFSACTWTTQVFPIVKLNGIDYEFVDTVGLNAYRSPSSKKEDEGSDDEDDEEQVTKVDPRTTAANLAKLLLRNKDGFNLLIFVIKAGRGLDHMMKNYDLFVNKLVAAQIKVILVVTECEREDSLDSWVKRNRKAIERNMKFATIVGTCFAKSNNELEKFYKKTRDASKRRVIEALNDYSSPHRCQISNKGVVLFLRSVWNWFALTFRFSLFGGDGVFWLNTFNQILVEFGCSKKEAVQLEQEVMQEVNKAE